MKNLTTPKAVLIGLAMIALAILFQPAVSRLIISPAYAEGLDSSDFRMFSSGLSNIASAIHSIRACQN
jgi:hypothetical protein